MTEIQPAPTSPDHADPHRLAVYIDHLTLRMIQRKVGSETYNVCRFVEAAIKEKLTRRESND